MGSDMKDDRVRRVDATRVSIANDEGVPVTLFASQDVACERRAVDQLLELVALQGSLRRLDGTGFFGDRPARLRRVVVTPDFHRGGGIPVGTVAECEGFVIPQAVGNDVCCGMRLLATDVTRGELMGAVDRLDGPLRAVFFQGRRDIPLSPRQREALLRGGLPGLHEARGDNAGRGTWAYYDGGAELDRLHLGGVLPAQGIFAFADWVRGSGASDGRDAQIGSVGGGNHFVELQVVEELFDGYPAYEWGLGREQVTIMVHSGSVGLGHVVGGHFLDAARDLWPRAVPRPEHGFFPLPTDGPHAALAARYLDAMANAANFAFGNRLFLGLMAVRVLSEVLGRRVATRLVYDAPHNLIWDRGGGVYLHRKGACPAPGPDPDTPFAYTGHPVIIPGSMGASSYVLAGCGAADALESACHGAGRVLSRGETHHVAADRHQAAVAPLRVVTPIDPSAPEVRLRRDILAKHEERLREEAPYAYKDVTPVVRTVEDAGIARRVARLWPILTVKG